MKKVIAAFAATAVLLTGCASADDGTKTGDPGTTDKDYSSNTEREFKQPDEFYDYGDFTYVKVFTLQDGTRCVIASNQDDGGMGVTCNWINPTTAPSASPYTEDDDVTE